MATPNQPQQTEAEQIAELMVIMRANRVDAWDLGFQGQLSPGDYENGLKTYLQRFGYAQTKNMLGFLKKTPR